ncbi:VOC family protein [Desulfitobacterium sp. THU1]|uniref:VOC family protein n=1 Tax=Desulfitobacterium sp. THU1 TaxID=3138072 RepID=UPI00311FF156
MSDWLIPYITFNGDCEEAVKFYQSALGGETQILRYGDAPPNPNFPVSEEMKNRVLHAELRKDGHIIRCADNFPGAPFTQGNAISFAVEFSSEEEIRKAFADLSQGGTVEMDLQKTFFSPLYAKFTDKFGVHWQLHCKK